MTKPYYMFLIAKAFVETIFTLPFNIFREREYSVKNGRLILEAIREAFPNEEPTLKYASSLYEGIMGGKVEISRGISTRFQHFLYPHGFTEPQVAVLTTICYEGLISSGGIFPPQWQVHSHNGLCGTSKVSKEEASQALEELVESGYIIESKGRFHIARKIDSLLVA